MADPLDGKNTVTLPKYLATIMLVCANKYLVTVSQGAPAASHSRTSPSQQGPSLNKYLLAKILATTSLLVPEPELRTSQSLFQFFLSIAP